MKRVSRKTKLVKSPPTLTEQIAERKQEFETNKKKNWQEYLKRVGVSPLAPGSKELSEAVAWIEKIILDCCTEQDGITISFEHGLAHELPFFPKDSELGHTEFADKFRRRAAKNLSKELKAKDPNLTVQRLYQAVEFRW